MVESTKFEKMETNIETETSKEDLKATIDDILNRQETKLLWRVDSVPEMNRTVKLYDLRIISQEEIKNSLLSEIFKSYEVLSDTTDTSGEYIKLTDSNQNEIMISFEKDSNYFEIRFSDNIADKTHKKIVETIVSYAEKTANVKCMQTDYQEDEEDATQKYLFYPDGILYDIGGRGDVGNDVWIAGSGLVIDEDGTICVQQLAEFVPKDSTINLSDCLTLEEIQMICEAAWSNYPESSVAVAESMNLGYIVGKEGNEIIPIWQINGYYRRADDKNNRILRIMIDAKSGEVIQYS
jgi:hypothetical protein